MNRRKALKVSAGVVVGGGIGLYTLTNAFKPKIEFDNEAHKLDYEHTEGKWNYSLLDPEATAGLAYKYYSEGSCMYAIVKSIIFQLAEKTGEPYISFPIHMFKYGHGGIGGVGSVCGALNGAASLIGLLITEKSVRDKIITDIFRWYEKTPLPQYNPQNPNFDFSPAKSVSGSVLCHASNTNWCKAAGYKANSKERKERCRRMAGDVANKVASALNDIFTNTYTTNVYNDKTVETCVTCHGSKGKVNNAAVKMSCNSCHTKSLGHRIFSDIHYKLIKK